jgi:hypothetical protein
MHKPVGGKLSATNLKSFPPIYDCVLNVRALLFNFFFARMNVFFFNLWEPSKGTSHMLHNRYQGNALTNCYQSKDISMVTPRYGCKGTAERSASLAVCARDKGFPLGTGRRRNRHERCRSELDALDRLARTFQQCSLHCGQREVVIMNERKGSHANYIRHLIFNILIF